MGRQGGAGAGQGGPRSLGRAARRLGRAGGLRYTEQDARLSESRGEEALEPMLLLVPWTEVRYVSVALEDLESS